MFLICINTHFIFFDPYPFCAFFFRDILSLIKYKKESGQKKKLSCLRDSRPIIDHHISSNPLAQGFQVTTYPTLKLGRRLPPSWKVYFRKQKNSLICRIGHKNQPRNGCKTLVEQKAGIWTSVQCWCWTKKEIISSEERLNLDL